MDTALSSQSSKITVAQIAAAAGVSPATVSRVINQQNIVKEKTYSHVTQVMKELGYVLPEKGKNDLFPESTDYTNTTTAASKGLLLYNFPDLSNPICGSLIRSAKASARRHGYTLLLNEGHINMDTLHSYLQIIRNNHVLGMITTNQIETPALKRLADAVCLVQCSEYNEELNLPYVSVDDETASKIATEHLLNQGRKNIAFINGPLTYKYARYRLQGYTRALKEAGIPLRKEYIINLPDIDSDLSISAALQLLSLAEPPDGFFLSSDVFAASVLRACHLVGKKVPEEVSVVGFDDLPTSKIMTPSLSSVKQPTLQMGFMAVEMLVEKLAAPNIPPKKVFLETELIIRESSSLV